MKMGDVAVLERSHVDALFQALRGRGYRVLGPTVRDGAIVYDDVRGAADLPAGWTDDQAPAHYGLRRREDEALLGFAAPPQSWKRFLFPPALTLFQARRKEGAFEIAEAEGQPPLMAFFGVRACELAAIATQDRVLMGGPFVDPHYKARRERVFIVAAHCLEPGGTCFCASMGTGPRARSGFDLALSERLAEGRHAFLVEAGTPLGAELMAEVPHAPASEADRRWADEALAVAATRMGRTLATDGLKERLYRSYESPRFEQVAQRCLACANCTMVCPTCFCASVEDVTDLTGQAAERVRRWDSCFSLDFSYLHGGAVRQSVAARYRQWMLHKLATWHDQFGGGGCVGCGRCITWCPTGIDITEEARA
jgi:ferredoxin